MKKTIILAFIIASSSLTISAQVFTTPRIQPVITPNRIWSDFRIAQIGNQMAADMARNAKSGKVRTGNSSKTATASKTSTNTASVYQLRFAFRRLENSPLAQKMVEAGNGSAQDLAKMRQLVAYLWNKYELSFADENKRLGMPFNDTVTAMTYYIVLSYIYAYDLPSLPSENSVAVYKQLSGIMSNNTEFAKLAPTDKQLFAELLIAMGGMPMVSYEQNRNNTEKMSLGMANLERLFGAQAKTLRITASGVEF